MNSFAVNPVDVYGNAVPAHPWVGEDIHPDTGHWLARAYLYSQNSTLKNRGWMYNHATYCDNVLHGLVGIRTSLDPASVVVNPLVPDRAMQWFAADGVSYHRSILTVFWDEDGSRYGRGKGLHVWVDGEPRAHRPTLGPVKVRLQ